MTYLIDKVEIRALPKRPSTTSTPHNTEIEMNAIASPANDTFFADWRTFESTHRIRVVKVMTDSLETTWDDDRISRYHFLWLRDNCPCSSASIRVLANKCSRWWMPRMT